VFLNFNAGDKKQKIMMAAARVFAQKGFHQSKIEEIAQEADVGKGTVYEYFASKLDLFSQMFQAGIWFYRDTISQEVKPELTISEQLRRFVYLHLEFVRSHQDIAGVLRQELIHVSPQVQGTIMEAHREIIKMLVGIFQEGIREGIFRQIDCELAAGMFFGAVHAVGASAGKTALDIEKFACGIVDVFLKGIEKK
jgi:TetR/AcrR family fatty acid metabolism transcriptional regulator